MLQSIKEDIRKTFQYGNMVNRLLIINLAVFVVLLLLNVFLKPFGDLPETILRNLQISSDTVRLLLKPWTIITHMFVHVGVWHIVWNMLLFYWFGKIVGDLIGDHKILPIYIYGGLVGALAFMISYNLMGMGQGVTGFAHGASAAVMAIIMVAALIAPDYSMRLLLIGDVKIKYIALGLIILDLAGSAGDINTGGHIAHLGGVFFGWFYVNMYQNGKDLADPFNNFIEKIQSFFKPKQVQKKTPLNVRFKAENFTRSKGHRSSDKRSHDLPFQERLDKILEKIKENGYDNLTDEEKEFLFLASKK